MASQDTPANVRAEVCETRIALAFFGGVSLAVYESGVAVEFFRLVAGDGVYQKLRDQIGPVIVDIISGTSAGGLSASFLGTALINGSSDLDPLMKLWLDKASFDTLLTPSNKKDPRSLLNGDQFLELIKEALQKIAGGGIDREPHQRYLDLFITATSLEGDVKPFDLHGQHIKARSHQRVFHFRYRDQDLRQRNIGEQPCNDFTPEKQELIAIAARTSASFPVAFEPVAIEREKFRGISPDLEKDSLHVDGGILDNKPIRLALDAIFRRRADKQVDRRLFYIEPMPEEISQTDRPWNPLRVLYAAVKDLPSYQSITSALDEIQQRNKEVDEVRQTLKYYEALAAKTQAAPVGLAGLTTDHSFSLQPACRPDMRAPHYIPAGSDMATQLFRAQEDGYLDLRLSREFADLAKPCLVIADLLTPPDSEPATTADLQKVFYLIKNRILWACDFTYHRRQYHYLHEVIRRLFTQLDEGEIFRNQDDRRDIFLLLNDLRTLLNDQEAQIVKEQEQTENEQQQTIRIVENWLSDLAAALKSKGGQSDLRATFASTDRDISQLVTIKTRCGFFLRLREEVKQQLDLMRHKLETMRQRPSPSDPNTEEMTAAIERGYNSLRVALDHFHERDMIIYPMSHGRNVLASELQRVLVARVGPLDGSNYINLTDPNFKLAGEEAFHFGGFMDATWRGNDLIWGRLDAVENIFRQLLPGGERNPLFQQCVKAEQKRIVVEMRRKFDKGIVYPLEKQDQNGEPPNEDLLIGKQNIRNISTTKKVLWLKEGMTTIIAMISLPGLRVPEWCQRSMSKFFVQLLIRPRRALLWAALLFVMTTLLIAAVIVRFVKVPVLGPSPTATGEMLVVLWLALLVAVCLLVGKLAHSVRARFLHDQFASKKAK